MKSGLSATKTIKLVSRHSERELYHLMMHHLNRINRQTTRRRRIKVLRRFLEYSDAYSFSSFVQEQAIQRQLAIIEPGQ